MKCLPKTLSNHPSLVGIVRFPRCECELIDTPVPLIVKGDDKKFKSLRQNVKMAKVINSKSVESTPIKINKNELVDFYPYTYYVLSDGEADPVVMLPQFLRNELIIKGEYALSHQPVERFYPNYYKGDSSGMVYNITNLNQMMLPTATNEGINYMNASANTIMQNRSNQVTGNVLNGIGALTSAIANPMTIGYGVSSVINGINSIKETDARNKDIMLTPNTISSFGTPSTRKSFNTDCVKVLKYTIQNKMKDKIRAYTKRYGNKYNNYSKIDLTNYKGYIKFISPNVDSKIDNIYVNKIIQILERGIYFE